MDSRSSKGPYRTGTVHVLGQYSKWCSIAGALYLSQAAPSDDYGGGEPAGHGYYESSWGCATRRHLPRLALPHTGAERGVE